MLAPDEVLVASINGVFGVRGEVRLFLHDRQSRTLAKPVDVTILSPEGERRTVRIAIRSGAGKRIIAKIDGIDTPEVAHTYIGWNVIVPRSALPAPGKGEYYIHDLLDLPVLEQEDDEEPTPLGKLDDVVTGDRDIWVIATPADGDMFLMASPENVRLVDIEGGRLVVRKGAAAAAE